MDIPVQRVDCNIKVLRCELEM